MRASRAGPLSASAAVVLSAWSYGPLAGIEHRPADVTEVQLALAVRDEHAMRAQEIGAEQHRLVARRVLGHATGGVGVSGVLPDIREADANVGNALVADGEALESADVPFHAARAEAAALAAGNA